MLRLVFTASNSWVAGIIRTLTGGRASHVGIEIEPGKFLQADKGGVQYSTLEEFLGDDRKIIGIFEAKSETLPLLDIEYCKGLLGSGYDYLGLVGEAIPILSWKWFKLKLSNPFASAQKFVCSEFAMMLDQKHQLPEFKGLTPDTTSPATLMKVIQKGNSFTKVATL